MQRRDFLQKTACLSAILAAASYNSLAFSTTTKTPPQSYKQKFDLALKTNTKLRGWQGLQADMPEHFSAWQGKLPEQLIGKILYRNGPGRRELGGVRYSHWFDGDGFVSRFHLQEAGVIHSGKFVKTKKFIKERKVKRFLYDGAGTKIKNAGAIRGPETLNPANTALMPIQGELWALWEAASPYRLALDNLDTLGQVEFNDELAGVPFSAHPHQDSKGNWFNFGDISFAGKSAIVVYQLNKAGKLEQYKTLPLPRNSYMHDFTMTEDYLIFYLPALIMDELEPVYIDSFSWRPQEGGRLMIVDKNTLTTVKTIEQDAGFIFHFGNSWQQGNEIIINACCYKDATIMTHAMADIVDNLAGQYFEPSTASQIRVNLSNGRATVDRTNIAFEFLQYDQRYHGKPSRYQMGVSMSDKLKINEFDSVSMLDTESGIIDQFSFSAGTITEEPLFVANTNSTKEGEGFLIHSYLDHKNGHSGVCVFNALNLSAGPLATMKLPYYLPLGFHGTIV